MGERKYNLLEANRILSMKIPMAWVRTLAASFILLFGSDASTQELEFPISPSPVGSGARAAGMADAFVAIADDATAASWNPAGLVQLERPEFSVVGSFNALREDFDALGHPEFLSEHTDSNVDLNFMSFVYPLPTLPTGRNASVSLSYQRKYDFSRSFETDFLTSFQIGSLVADQLQTIQYDQEGGLSAITGTLAVELTRRLSIGVAINFWRDSFLGSNGWSQTTDEFALTSIGDNEPTVTERSLTESYRNFRAENYVIGILWNFSEGWNLGVRYDTGFTGTTKFRSDSSSFETVNEKRRVEFPATLALGLSRRVNDRLTFSVDFSFTKWEKFRVTREDGSQFSLIDASDPRDTDSPSNFDPTITVRLGVEYLFIDRIQRERMDYLWSLRGGLFYDQEPASGESLGDGNGTSGEPDDFYGIAGGIGLLVHGSLNLDLAYQLRYGPNVNADFFRGVDGFNEDVTQHRVLVSAVLYF